MNELSEAAVIHISLSLVNTQENAITMVTLRSWNTFPSSETHRGIAASIHIKFSTLLVAVVGIGDSHNLKRNEEGIKVRREAMN